MDRKKIKADLLAYAADKETSKVERQDIGRILEDLDRWTDEQLELPIGPPAMMVAFLTQRLSTQGRTPTRGAAGDLVTREELETRLRNLKVATVKGPAHTTSYEQYYANMKVGQMELKDFLSQNLPTIEEEDVPSLPSMDVGENEVMLPGFLNVLKSLRGAGGQPLEYDVFDTHTQRYLSGCGPDITVVKRGTVVNGFNAIFVIELQRGQLDNLHRGKALRYCELLMEANASRGFAVCVLTNMENLEVYKVRRTPDKDLVRERSNTVKVQTGGGWAYIKNLLQQGCESLGYHLPVLVLNGKKHEPDGFLGEGRGVEVYQVQYDGQPMVCKVHAGTRARSFDRELAALEALRDSGTAAGSSLWPTLVECNMETRLLLTQPVVDPLELWTWDGLRDMFLGLRHLHTVVKWVHRDLEPKHICRARSDMRMCLYDLSSAAPLPGVDLQTTSQSQQSPSKEEEYYAGTLLYASEDVLAAVESQRSCPAHVRQDLVPLVKSVYIMIHASASADMLGLAEHVQRLMQEGRHAVGTMNIRSFWDKELSEATPGGKLWRGMLALANTDQMQAEAYATTTDQLRDQLACMMRGVDKLPHVFDSA